MKIVRIEIEETSFIGPYIEMIKESEPLSVTAMFDGKDITDLDALPPSRKREIYPSQLFVVDRETYDRFYIRDEDKQIFEDLVKALVKRGRRNVLQQAYDMVSNYKGKVNKYWVMDLMQEMRDREEKLK